MDMKELVDKITRDVVETLKNQPNIGYASPCVSAGGKVLLIVEESLTSSQWEQVFNNLGNCAISLLNLGNSHMPSSAKTSETFFSAETVRGSFSQVVYVASSYYQLSAIAGMMDNFKGVKVFLDMACSSCNPALINLTPQGCFASRVSKILSDISAMGISVNGCQSSSPQISSCSSGSCDGAKGECSGCGQCPTLAKQSVAEVVSAGAARISAGPGNSGFDRALAAQIDHTLLKADATKEEVIKLCQEAREYIFASVCINPGHVKLASDCLKGSPVKVCTVIGFPLGATTSVTKALETRDAIANGADEIDMVINVGAMKAGNHDLVQKDIEAVVQAANGNLVKVILETALLTDEEKVIACNLSKNAGADFVKTSTGFGPGGATPKDVALMRETVGSYMGVKASGGIRDLPTAQAMIKAGATRVGASASVAIVKGEKGKSAY